MNRYWYSEKQKKNHESHENNSKAEVLTDSGWKEYTQWCSDGGVCPWDDAVLVAESVKKLKLRLNGKEQI